MTQAKISFKLNIFNVDAVTNRRSQWKQTFWKDGGLKRFFGG